jgi:hypothetical protein
MLEQFKRPWGNGPWSPRLLRLKLARMFPPSPEYQHRTPENWQMKLLVLLAKSHDDLSTPLGSITDCWTDFRHWISSSEPKHNDELLKSSNQRRDLLPLAIPDGQTWSKTNSLLSPKLESASQIWCSPAQNLCKKNTRTHWL